MSKRYPDARHPQGRSCGKDLFLVLLLMPYAMARYGLDVWRSRPAKPNGIRPPKATPINRRPLSPAHAHRPR